MQDILLISEDTLFIRMMTLEFARMHQTVRSADALTVQELEEVLRTEPCRLLLLDLDIIYDGLELILNQAMENKLPVILFGYPDSEAMTPEKLRFYDSDIYRYVFQRPFLMHQFLYCAKELLHYKEEMLASREAPAMKMKQHCPADDIQINEDTRTVTYKNHPVTLTKTEFDLLWYLMLHRGSAIPRTQLYREVWQPEEGDDSGSNTVDVYIRYLRAKLDDPYHIKLIETVRGIGYSIRKD